MSALGIKLWQFLVLILKFVPTKKTYRIKRLATFALFLFPCPCSMIQKMIICLFCLTRHFIFDNCCLVFLIFLFKLFIALF